MIRCVWFLHSNFHRRMFWHSICFDKRFLMTGALRPADLLPRRFRQIILSRCHGTLGIQSVLGFFWSLPFRLCRLKLGQVCRLMAVSFSFFFCIGSSELCVSAWQSKLSWAKLSASNRSHLKRIDDKANTITKFITSSWSSMSCSTSINIPSPPPPPPKKKKRRRRKSLFRRNDNSYSSSVYTATNKKSTRKHWTNYTDEQGISSWHSFGKEKPVRRDQRNRSYPFWLSIDG